MEHIVLSIGNVSWPECFSAIKEKSDAYLIDVRTKEEWEQTGIAELGANNKDQLKLITWMIFNPFSHINNNFMNELMNKIPNKESELYFICRSGKRSYQAAEATMQAGYKNCFNVENGLTEEIARIKL
jgi:rhodanese-related sulfurtransferase